MFTGEKILKCVNIWRSYRHCRASKWRTCRRSGV